ncbi:MAG TPA: metal ABC transporter ATP-binding protein [Nitrososphaera sp.]|jgi:zinc transport system ATP-binding protein
MQIVEVNRLSYAYSGTLVLSNISFTIEEGDILGIIGPNGAGKTTLFSCMLGLRDDYTGTIKILGEEIKKKKSKVFKSIGYIPQKNTVDQNFPATVEEIVSLGINVTGKTSKEKIALALETVDLLAQKDRRIGELSGGQQQRVLIAKAMVNDPKLLILDEPATGIDLEMQNKFYSLLKKLNQENKITIIWASHDLDAVNRLATNVACINRSMFFHGKAYEFFENPDLLKAYSESSMQAHMHLHNHTHRG